MAEKHDMQMSAIFSARCAEARSELLRSMATRGLREKDGWRIVETMRSVVGGSELVLRPLHLHLPSPPDLECTVRITEQSQVESRCSPDRRPTD